MSAPGRFITLEGGEGAGKSTQAKLLKEYLEAQGLRVELTREPGGTEGAERIRELLLQSPADAWDAETETLLFLAARRDHVKKKIQPLLAQGVWVICDRFADSTRCYQGAAGSLGMEYVQMLHRLALGDVEPDLTFILDLPVETGFARAASRGEAADRFEKKNREFHERVRAGFLFLADCFPRRCAVVDASLTPQAVHQALRETLTARFL